MQLNTTVSPNCLKYMRSTGGAAEGRPPRQRSTTTHINSQLAAVKERSDAGHTRKQTSIITESCAAIFGEELAANANLVRAIPLHAAAAGWGREEGPSEEGWSRRGPLLTSTVLKRTSPACRKLEDARLRPAGGPTRCGVPRPSLRAAVKRAPGPPPSPGGATTSPDVPARLLQVEGREVQRRQQLVAGPRGFSAADEAGEPPVHLGVVVDLDADAGHIPPQQQPRLGVHQEGMS